MTRSEKALAAAVPSLLWGSTSLAQGYSERDWFWHPMSGWGHMVFGGLMMLAFWGGTILLIVLLVRWLSGGGSGGHAPPQWRTPLEILQERLAKGEIDRDEYEERKRLLSD